MPSAADLSVSFVKRMVLPRHDRGIDWRERRRLLVGMGDETLLFIIPGTWVPVCGVRGFGRKYNPASLVLWRARHERYAGHATDTLVRGRITRSLLAAHAHTIDEAFGMPGLTAFLDLSKTALVEPRSPMPAIAPVTGR